MSLETLVAKAAHAAGAIAPCPFHSDETVSNGDPEAEKRAYAIVTNDLKAGGMVEDREEVMGTMKDLLEMAYEDCPRCEGSRYD